ncbi:MAG TPA: glycosyltransferase family 39 protein [Acidobacteriaceae bacterium]|jgi:4-amino-4-deoxy-L-arabinose transferase-like glycosyltransferase|nr:glycosyltransferase family 39 protein [Acidobacteriaceae bacterium]
MTSLRTAKRFVFPLLGLWVLLYASFSLVKPPLLDGEDALNAEIAREMVTAGHWITPMANGLRYAQHPPLLYWAVAASFRIFGVSDGSARLPVVVATLLIFIATFSLGRRLFRSPAAGFYAALALITSYGVFLFGHLLLRDVFLCLWTTTAISFFLRSLTQERHRLGTALGFGACCALGVLTQGLAGFLFPVVIVVAYLISTHNLQHLLRWYPIPAILVFLVLWLPWHVASDIASGHMRLGSLMPVMAGGRVPLFVFWPLLLLAVVPWCAFSLRALRIGASPQPERRRDARLLCLIWIAVVLIYFSFSARMEFNLMTALPPMALLAGGWLAEDEALPHHQGRVAAWILFFAGMTVAAFVAYFLFAAPPPAPGVDIATLLGPRPGQRPVFFTYLFDLTRNAMGLFKVPLSIVLASLLVGVSACLWYRLRDNARMANCFLAGMTVAILIGAHLALNTFSPILSSQILAEAIKPEVRPADVIVVNGPFDTASSFVFYLERQALILSGNAGRANPAPGNSTNPSMFVEAADVTTLWNGTDRVWLWTSASSVPNLPAPVYVIGRSGGKEVLSNQPNTGGAAF